jgi:hypothetical protein
MNIYVPKNKEALLAALDRAATLSNRPKNELVLEALERYLTGTERSVEFKSFSLGDMRTGRREELYRDRLEK